MKHYPKKKDYIFRGEKTFLALTSTDFLHLIFFFFFSYRIVGLNVKYWSYLDSLSSGDVIRRF